MPDGGSRTRRTIRSIRVSPTERHETGVIATLPDGKRSFAEHFVGVNTIATRAIADHCDTFGLKIVCLSTPETIYRDLQGDRHHDTDQVRAGDHRAPRDGVTTPETIMLGRIGRLDLLA
jgi:hypothetical protein